MTRVAREWRQYSLHLLVTKGATPVSESTQDALRVAVVSRAVWGHVRGGDCRNNNIGRVVETRSDAPVPTPARRSPTKARSDVVWLITTRYMLPPAPASTSILERTHGSDGKVPPYLAFSTTFSDRLRPERK